MKKKHLVLIVIAIFLFLFLCPVIQFDYQKPLGYWDGYGLELTFSNGTRHTYSTHSEIEKLGLEWNEVQDTILHQVGLGLSTRTWIHSFLESKYNCSVRWVAIGGQIYGTYHYGGSISHFLFKVGYGEERRI